MNSAFQLILFLLFTSTFASANATEIVYPSIEVLSVNVNAISLKKNLAETLDAALARHPLAACLYMGQALGSQENLMRTAGHVDASLGGILISGQTPPEWVHPLVNLLSPLSHYTAKLNQISEACDDSHGVLVAISESDLKQLIQEVSTFSESFEPYVKKAMEELYEGKLD